MGLYKSRFMTLVLAAMLGAGLIACDDGSDEDGAEEQETEEASGEAQLDEAEIEDLPFYATGPVARIDGEEIGEQEFNEIVRERTEQMPGELPPQMVEMFKEQSVNFVIDKHLVDEVLADEDIEVTEEDLDEALEDLKARMGDDAAQFEQQLQEMGMTEDDLRENMEQDVELEKYLATQNDLEVSDDEIREFYDENENEFVDEEQVEARHILIEVDEDADDDVEAEALERAEDVYQEAVDGGDFGELAREHSEGPTAERDGDLGTFARGAMVEPFSDTAFDDLEVGEISEPVRTQFGFHVIEKTDHIEGGEADFDDAREDIEMQLTHQKRQEAFQSFLEELKADVEIEEIADNIESNVEVPDQPQGQPMPHGEPGQQPQQPQQQPQQGGQQGGQQIEINPEDLEGGEDGQQLELDSEDLEIELGE